ncbi:MAG: hypothetical protein LN573_06915 [Rickettsia endosymbiont of Oxypoda opaca]|nr:hypothetical protein [Rickettsia endosymbiont of Oxypoda opaca]
MIKTLSLPTAFATIFKLLYSEQNLSTFLLVLSIGTKHISEDLKTVITNNKLFETNFYKNKSFYFEINT